MYIPICIVIDVHTNSQFKSKLSLEFLDAETCQAGGPGSHLNPRHLSTHLKHHLVSSAKVLPRVRCVIAVERLLIWGVELRYITAYIKLQDLSSSGWILRGTVNGNFKLAHHWNDVKINNVNHGTNNHKLCIERLEGHQKLLIRWILRWIIVYIHIYLKTKVQMLCHFWSLFLANQYGWWCYLVANVGHPESMFHVLNLYPSVSIFLS